MAFLHLPESMNDVSIPQLTNVLFCILQYKNEKVWIKLDELYIYEDLIRKAQNTFPSLNERDFIYTDENDARLEADVLFEFIRINPRGVVIKIKTVATDIIDISNFSSTFSETLKDQQNTNLDDSSHTISDTSDNFYVEHTSSPKKMKLNTSVTERNKIISEENLLNIIKKSPCGEEILEDYKKNKYLSEKYRKLLIKIVVQHLLQYKQKINRQILASVKCQYAEAVIKLFPNLKNSDGDLGYEHFYNPKTGTGYIASRLSNVQRKGSTSRITLEKKQKENIKDNITVEQIDESDIIKDSINFMKHATFEQKDIIIEKIKETFKVRRYLYLNEHFFDVFPRFLDIPELIHVEFELLFSEIDQEGFCKLYPEYINAILSVYETEKNNEIPFEWDRIVNSFIALIQLVPPTAKGKKFATREKAKNLINKLIVFTQNGKPLHSNESVNQPRIIAVGPNKKPG